MLGALGLGKWTTASPPIWPRCASTGKTPPRSSGRALRWVVGLSLVGGLAFAGWRVGGPMVEARLFKTEVSVTEVALVSPAQAQVQLTSTGYVVPQVQVDVSSKLVGRVAQGERSARAAWSRTGQILFELDAERPARRGRERAGPRRGGARAGGDGARPARRDRAAARPREAPRRDAAPSARRRPTISAARAKSLEEQVRATDADVAASQAEVSALSTNLANTTIRAPIDGTVIAKPLLPGDVVVSGDAHGQDRRLLLHRGGDATCPRRACTWSARGVPCEIVLDAYPDKRWRGEVVERQPQLNRAKATATVKVRFLDRDDTVLPEMAARVSFLDAPLDVAKLKRAARSASCPARRWPSAGAPRSCSPSSGGTCG